MPAPFQFRLITLLAGTFLAAALFALVRAVVMAGYGMALCYAAGAMAFAALMITLYMPDRPHPRRRTLCAAAFGFVAGLLVYWWIG